MEETVLIMVSDKI